MDEITILEQDKINQEIQEIRKDFINKHPEYKDNFKEGYREGIIDDKEFSALNSDKRILWILKEPNTASFTPSCFKSYSTFKKQKTSYTFKLIAKCSYYLIEGVYTEDDRKLAEIMKRIAIINIKKTPGGKSTNQNNLKEFYSKHKELIKNQIKLIDPTVIIVANEMKLFVKDLNLTNCGDNNIDYIFTEKGEKGRRRTFKFKNKLFISSYHPNAKIKHKYYCNEIYKEYQKWMGEKDSLPEFKF